MFKIYKSTADKTTWKRNPPELIGEATTYEEAVTVASGATQLIDMAPLVWIDGPDERTQVTSWGSIRGQCTSIGLADGSLFKE